jgi:hypothetical protein
MLQKGHTVAGFLMEGVSPLEHHQGETSTTKPMHRNCQLQPNTHYLPPPLLLVVAVHILTIKTIAAWCLSKL